MINNLFSYGDLSKQRKSNPRFGATTREATFNFVKEALQKKPDDKHAQDIFIRRFGKDQLPRLEAEIRNGDTIMGDHVAYTSLSMLGRNRTPEAETSRQSTSSTPVKMRTPTELAAMPEFKTMFDNKEPYAKIGSELNATVGTVKKAAAKNKWTRNTGATADKKRHQPSYKHQPRHHK